uniref:Uncharacterized protein n=1 Tax=Anopheles coluzzii TaxID=1518534 RepID=A0A8W7PG29_ANOCL
MSSGSIFITSGSCGSGGHTSALGCSSRSISLWLILSARFLITVRSGRSTSSGGTTTTITTTTPTSWSTATTRSPGRARHLLTLQTLRNHSPLMVELGEQILRVFQRLLRRVHLRLLYTVPIGTRQTLPAEVHRHRVRLRVGVDGVLRHAEIVTNDGLRTIVYQRAAQQRQMPLVMLREVPVEILAADQLQYSVAQELEALIGPERKIGEPNGTIGKSTCQQPNVIELYTDGIFKTGEGFKHLERIDMMSITQRFLFLQRMRRIVHPYPAQRVILLEECVRKDTICHLDTSIEQQSSH